MATCPEFVSEAKPLLPTLKDTTNLPRHPWERSIKTIYSNKITHAHNSIRNPIYPKPKKKYFKDLIKFTVIGIKLNKEFIYCTHLVKMMHKYRPKTFDVPIIRGLTATEWPFSWSDLIIRLGQSVYCITTPVVILKNGQFFGGDKELKEFMESQYIYRICLNYREEAAQEFVRFVTSSGRPFVYMDISINENFVGTLIFMLYSDIVPITCENFIRLCNTRKGGYAGTPVHRIVKDGWIQCGGYGLKDSKLSCENFIVPHDKRGVLGMCNCGRDVDCSTQFFVLLQPSDWMNHKYVAFGQLVDGEKTLKIIENEPTYYESPTSSILIERAGILNLNCRNITINKRAREYINKHIEDLFETQEFLSELIWQRLWAEIEAKRRIEKERRKTESTASTAIQELDEQDSRFTLVTTQQGDEDKESNEFAVESYATGAMEEFRYSHATMVTAPTVKKNKPYYHPLTDEPYPGEVDSTFDLKKFLKGDYCLESDLQKDLHKDGKQREVLKIVYSKFPSDMFPFDNDEYDRPGSDVDSSEEEEIKNYIKNNVDRVSFAGDIIRNMVVRKGRAMSDLFAGVRKSEMPVLTDEDLKKFRRISLFEQTQRKSTFADEDLRRLRTASIFERGPPSDRRQSVKKQIQAIDELPKLVSDSTDKHEVSEDKGEEYHEPTSSMNTLVKLPSLTEDISIDKGWSKAGLSPEQIKRLRRISRLATKDKTKRQKKYKRSYDEEEGEDEEEVIKQGDKQFDSKRRQTVFAKDLARIQSYQKDILSDHDLGEKKAHIIRFPAGTLETSHEIKRRQTGYIHNTDLEQMNIYLEEDNEDDEGDEYDDHLNEDDNESDVVAEVTEEVKRKNTVSIDRNYSSIDKGQRESVFLRRYQGSFADEKDAPPPRLKDFKPMSETARKNLYLTFGKAIPIEPTRKQLESKTLVSDGSLLRLAKLTKYGKKTEAKISSEYVATLDKIDKTRFSELKVVPYTSKRPFLTVEEYQKKNEERIERLKKEEENKAIDKLSGK